MLKPSTSDGPIQRRTVERPRTSDMWASPAEARAHAELDLGIEPARFEALQEERPVAQTPVSPERGSEHKSPHFLRHISGSVRKRI